MTSPASDFRRRLRNAASRVAPDLTLTLVSIRSRRMIERQARALGLDALAEDVARATGGRVLVGPFRGMRLDPRALPVHTAPKLLGTYESELHGAIEAMVARAPARIVNVGTAEGYYAVGLARRLPAAEVYGFDADPRGARATRQNARINGVDERVRMDGILRPARLEALLSKGPCLVVMDVEGAEVDLLDPALVPSLGFADIVVELHPSVRPGAGPGLAGRFAATHDSRLIEQSGLEQKIALLDRVDGIDLARAVDERRADNAWLVLTARRRSGAG